MIINPIAGQQWRRHMSSLRLWQTGLTGVCKIKDDRYNTKPQSDIMGWFTSFHGSTVTEVCYSSLLQKSVTYRGLLRNPPLSQSRLEGRLDQKVDSILFHFRLAFDHISIDQKLQTTKGPSSKSQVNEDWTSYDYSLSAFS